MNDRRNTALRELIAAELAAERLGSGHTAAQVRLDRAKAAYARALDSAAATSDRTHQSPVARGAVKTRWLGA